jgi:hypothetical protein
MTNRTLQFYGYAYGNVPVQLNAHINGEVVFSGAVATLDEPIPSEIPSPAPVLFSLEDSPLFPTEFSGSLPMTVSVATGSGIALNEVFCNYMLVTTVTNSVVMENSSINGTTLTVGTVTSGTIQVGQSITDEAGNIDPDTVITSGSGSSWTVNISQTVASTTIQGGVITEYPGNATAFISCYSGTPTNSDNTEDPRSSVTIDGVVQNPTRNGLNGTWTWQVPQGSTLGCEFNISLGNVA